MKAQEKLWQVNLKEQLYEVGWVQQANNGLIIAAGTKGLLALDNNSGDIVWHIKDLKGVDKNSFQTVEGLPLFFVEYTPMVDKTRGIIINSGTGDIIYDTKNDGYSIKTYHILEDEACILFELSSEGDRSLVKFSLKTWEPEWTVSIGKPKGLTSKLGNTFGMSFIKHGPIFSQNGELIIGLKSQIISLDKNTGKVPWKHDADKAIKALVYSNLNNNLYLGIKGSKKLTVFDPNSGKDITPGKLKLKGTLLDIIDDGAGNLVLVETEGFNLINPKTGELIWKKSYKIDYLDEVIPYQDGYIAIGKNPKDGSISLVSNDGKKVWDSKVKGYAYYTTPTRAGILYISTERSNILDYNTGKDVWDKDVKFKSIPAVTYDDKENKVVLFENKKGYKFDLETGAIELFAEGIELENVNKKTPLEAEFIESGYFITASQHASVLTPSGKVLYTKYFDPVTSIGGLTGIAQRGLDVAGVDLDIEGSLQNLQQLKAISNGSYLSSGDQAETTSSTSTVAGLYVGPKGGAMTTVFEITKTGILILKTPKIISLSLPSRKIVTPAVISYSW
ncbi:MAG: PQQ-like beta-propeller repeat protein [Cytophagales bacterium]|nr:PQQ-like beta-propeller repeat protein [Cytophagales bacterium]